MSFAERIGAVLVAPRANAVEVLAHEEPGRLADDVWKLLVCKLVAANIVGLLRAFYVGRDLGLGPAFSSVVHVATTSLPDFVGILIAGFVMSLLLRKKKSARFAYDLGAAAWIPYLAINVVLALTFTVLQRSPGEVTRHVFDGVGLAWATYVWATGLIAGLKESPT